MKPLVVLLALISALFVPGYLGAQCSGGTSALIVQHDTTVTGIGNSSHSFTVPKFDPSLGTLLSAAINSSASLAYSYALTNNDPSLTHTYKTQIVRSDDIFSAALDPSSINEVHQTPFVFATLAAGQRVNYGPAKLAYTVTNSITDSRLINFEGPGVVNFDYEIGTSALTLLSTKYDFNFNSALDTTTFSVTYRYCLNVLLSQEQLLFNASRQSNNSALLTWKQSTTQEGRFYEVQASEDGLTFNRLAGVAENITGMYDYHYGNASAKKVFFRIQQKNVSGEIKYSRTRVVEFNKDITGSPQVFPTLYTGGQIKVDFPEQGDWLITMYAADGRKVLMHRESNATRTSITVPALLPNGIYVIDIFNSKSQQRNVSRIIIHR